MYTTSNSIRAPPFSFPHRRQSSGLSAPRTVSHERYATSNQNACEVKVHPIHHLHRSPRVFRLPAVTIMLLHLCGARSAWSIGRVSIAVHRHALPKLPPGPRPARCHEHYFRISCRIPPHEKWDGNVRHLPCGMKLHAPHNAMHAQGAGADGSTECTGLARLLSM